MKGKYLIGATLMVLATASNAGRPFQEEVICPVGGEKFSIIITNSCTNFGGSQDFLLRSLTSCDFTTKLPQCPENKLPLYKKFQPEDVAKLENFIKSDDYRNYTSKSRYLLAYKVEKHLTGTTIPTDSDLYLLWNGLQFDRQTNLADPEYMKIFLQSANAKIDSTDNKQEANYIRALLAYIHYYQGSFEQSKAQIEIVKNSESIKDDEFINTYLKRIEDCVSSKDNRKCKSTEAVMQSDS